MTVPALFELTPTPSLELPAQTVTPGPVPDLTDYDIISANLSGGADSFGMLHELMRAARAAGVEDRVWTVHASLQVEEWPDVQVDGQLYPGAAGTAAAQSLFCGIPPERHLQRSKMTLDQAPDVFDLLTFVAEYGRFMRKDTPYCRKSWKETVEETAFTPVINGLKLTLGLAERPNAVKLRRPVRRLKVLGLRGDESRDRKKHPVYRCVKRNGVRHVDEWIPIKDWTKAQVWQLHGETGMPYQWTYDSHPGAGDRRGTSRCSCSLCFLMSRRDSLIGARRRPRVTGLMARIEDVRGDTFRADWSMSQLITWARQPGGPDPGIVLADDTPEFDRAERAIELALTRPPRRTPDLALRDRAARGDCTACL